MAICNDPAISYLKEFGYSVLRLPRADFQPLQVLSLHKGELQPLGDLTTIMVPQPGSGIGLPKLRKDVVASSISGQRTNDLSLTVGLNIIGNIIGAMGGGKLGLDAGFKKARTVAFEFLDVLMDDVAIAQLDQYLGTCDVNPASKHVSTLLDADDVFVVTATIKSKKFNVDSKDSSGTEVAVDVPVISEIVGGNIGVKNAANSATKLTFEGPSQLVFGFQAIQLYYVEGRYTAFKPLDPGTAAARALQPLSSLPKGVKALSGPGAFAPISFS